MTDEEYLLARGWAEPAYDDGYWTHPRRKNGVGDAEWFPLEQAVAAQLAEDRACYNFVREHSEMHGGMLTPKEPR